MIKEKKKEKGKDLDIDLGIVKFSLGGLFQGIEKIIDLAAELKEKGGKVKREGEIDLSHLKKGMKGVYGFSIKTAVGGEPVVEEFGNIKKTQEGAAVKDEREPITDLFEETEEIVVIAEMPGVDEQDIRLDLKGDILEILAQRGERKYYKEILIPSKTESGKMTSSYKNGILEIRMKKGR